MPDTTYTAQTRSGGDYERLTDKALTRTTFSDETAKQGAVYYYMITAVDRAGNESTGSVEKVGPDRETEVIWAKLVPPCGGFALVQ